MKYISKIIIMMLFVPLWSKCNIPPSTISAPITTPSSEVVQLPQETSLQTPTSREVIPTATSTAALRPSLAPTITPIPTRQDVDVCQNGSNPANEIAGLSSTGVIIYQIPNTKRFHSVGGSPLAYSRFTNIADQEYQSWGISPDGNVFAFAPKPDPQNNNIHEMPYFLLSSDGTLTEKKIDISQYLDQILEGNVFINWIGWWNGSGLLSIVFQNQFPNGDSGIDYVLGVLDPYQATWRDDLVGEFEGIDLRKRIYLSQDNTRALYLRTSGRLVLWDLVEHKDLKLQRYDPIDDWGPNLTWSPDSSLAAFNSWLDDKIHIVSRDGGEIMKSLQLPESVADDDHVIRDFQFSPGSDMLAVSTEIDQNGLFSGRSEIFIWDVKTASIIYRCETLGGNYDIGWSPDENYLFTKGDNPLLVFDLKTNIVTKLDQVGIGIGWQNLNMH